MGGVVKRCDMAISIEPPAGSVPVEVAEPYGSLIIRVPSVAEHPNYTPGIARGEFVWRTADGIEIDLVALLQEANMLRSSSYVGNPARTDGERMIEVLTW